jgi:hypothetical protein
LSAQAVQGGRRIGESAFGVRYLLFDGTEVEAGARLRGIAAHPETIDAGFDIPQILPEIVNQIDKDGFRRRDFGC